MVLDVFFPLALAGGRHSSERQYFLQCGVTCSGRGTFLREKMAFPQNYGYILERDFVYLLCCHCFIVYVYYYLYIYVVQPLTSILYRIEVSFNLPPPPLLLFHIFIFIQKYICIYIQSLMCTYTYMHTQ